jgi:hypothetical protein
MKSLSLFKAALAASLLSLLAACGGGGDTAAPATPLPPVAWASPAVFVTPGAANKSFGLTGCTLSTNIDTYNYNVSPSTYSNTSTSVNLHTATLVIDSSGDVSLKAATTVTGTINSLWIMAYSDAAYMNWSVGGTSKTPSYTINANEQLRNGNRYMNVYSSVEQSEVRLEFNTNVYVNNIRTYTSVGLNCEMVDKLALQVLADQARAAKNLGTAAGVNSFDNYDVQGSIEGGKAFWADSNALPQFSNLRFDLATGELASSTSKTGTYSPLSLALPSGEFEEGAYSESINRGRSEFGYKDAKGIYICKNNYANDTGFSIDATAYGNKFYPRRGGGRFMLATSNEAPQGESEYRFSCQDK